METIGRAARAAWSNLVRLWQFWMRDIQSRKSFAGKAVSIGIGLFAICCVCGAMQTAARGVGEAVGIVATRTPTPLPTMTPTPSVTLVPTATAPPAATEADPTQTPAPTRVVTEQADAQIIDQGALRAAPRLTGDQIGLVCPGDAVAVLERGGIWHRIQVVTIGPECGSGHAPPGSEGWVAFQNVRLPTQTPAPTATARPTQPVLPTEPPTTTSQPTAAPRPTLAPRPTAPPVAPRPTRNPLNTGGIDRYNCPDFATWREANAVYQANLPGDPNRLDNDDDGIPCENLPGAP